MPILNVCNLCKTYQAGEAEVKALDNVSFTVEKANLFLSSVRRDRENRPCYISLPVLTAPPPARCM